VGTDIHLQVERKVPGGWEIVSDTFPQWPYPKDAEGNTIWPKDDPTWRNYNLFAFLANVRNGYGFAGSYRGEPVEPQFAGRGLPDDMCTPKEDDEGGAWLGDHSWTHATFKELLGAPWGLVFHSAGIVTASEYERWREEDGAEGAPMSWCGGVGGVVWESDKYERYRDRDNRDWLDPFQEVSHPINVRVEWDWLPLQNSGFFNWLHGETIQALIAKHGSENLRLLIGFDS
jgi:hypothetical protein